MKIISKNDGWLTNYEVYVALTAEQARQADKEIRKMSNNSQAIQRQVLRYLQDYTPVEAMSAETMKACLQELAPYGLAHSETLELLNHAPQSDVFTYMLIPQARHAEESAEEKWRAVTAITSHVLLVPDVAANREALQQEVRELCAEQKRGGGTG